MKHLQEALDSYKGENKQFMKVEGNTLTFQIQDGPIKEVGVNGCQVTDVLEYINEIYKSLNAAFPCRENALTITKIEEGLHWQDARTKDHQRRQVEGLNKA